MYTGDRIVSTFKHALHHHMMVTGILRFIGVMMLSFSLTHSDGQAPVLDPSKSPTLAAVNEDAGAPVGAVGTLVSSLVDPTVPSGQLDNVADPDPGALLGIAVMGANTSNGTWHYSINGGTNWLPLGVVSDANARLLAADLNTRLYFQPNANYNGTLANAITFRAWDQTAGTNGGLMAVPGGALTILDDCDVSSYSNNDGSQNWAGDWAENDNGGGGFSGGDIDLPAPFLRFRPSQVGEWLYREADLQGATSATLSFDLIYNIINPGGQVQVQISDNGGSTYTTLSTITNATPLGVLSYNITAFASSNTRFRLYASAASINGIRLDYVRVDLTRTGGSASAFSSSTDVAGMVVGPVADTPSITNASTNEDTQTTSGLVISRNIVDGAEVTHFKITGITNGTLFLNDGVTPVTNGTFVTFAQGNAGLRFTPAYNFSGNGSSTIQASVSNVDAGLGGSTATATITVTGQPDLQGIVFEDMNYGGGSGRDRATAIGGGGSVRQNARVELYNATGNFISSTLTDASGLYTFDLLTIGTYTVRVVNSTVSSARAGFVANTHLAVQTYRTSANTGSVVAVSDHVGGEVPGKADAGNGSTTLGALTTATTTAQSITSVNLGTANVTNVDFGFSYNVVVNKNDAGQGSLRQVMTNMNALSNAGLAIQGRTAGIDHGVFMLADGVARPGLTVTYATMFVSGAATIVPLTPLPSISTPMVLDATTHPLFSSTPILEINGASAGAATDGFTLAAGSTGSTIKGFVINRFLGDGIQVNAGGSFIQGNYIGVNVAGSAALANALTGVNINNVGTTTIGGAAAGQGNTIAGNGGAEVQINGASALNNTVQGNMIGVRFNGTTVIPSAGSGVVVSGGADGTLIGGNVAGAGNIIGGNALTGVDIRDAGTTTTTVSGNHIGTNASDADLGNTQQGVKFSNGTTANVIGGTLAGSGNTIAWNDMQGIASITGTDAGNRFLGNSIHDNSLLGIDLNNDGVTYNDPGDADTGPNAKQNFPKLTGANTVGGNTTITGTFNSTSNTTYRIEYFSSPIGDGSGYGEGTAFLGTNNITTNGSGNATINVTFPVTVPSGHAVCATATNLTTNNTSEFSAFAQAPTDSDVDGVTDDIDIDDDNDGIPDDIEDLGFDSRGGTMACTQPAMNFQNPVLDAGTANTPGAVYRFSNVIPGIDARLSITAMSNASIVTVDDAALGTPDSWQPVIDFTGIGTPGIDFNMSFVLAGTTTPAAGITRFGGTTYDVDGTGEVESFLFTAPSVYAVDQPSLLVYQTLPGGLVDISGDGTTDGPGISGDPRYRAYFQYKNTNQFNFRCQYKRTTTGTTQRYLSLRFNECFLNDLVNVQLYIVDGLDTDGDGVPDYLDVDSDNDGIYDVVEAGSGQPQTNGVLNGGVTTSGLKVSVDANLNNAIDYTLRDSDGDNTYDGVELDSDNDGCRDVWEAGFTDNNGDGLLGNMPLIANNSGKVTTGTDGYTTPADQNSNGVYDHREVFAMSMTCPANISIPAGAGVCTAAVTVPAPTVFGACGGFTLTNSFNATANASGTYPKGATTVTFTATDLMGNTLTCSMTVTVNDTQLPQITCPANIAVNNDPSVCGAAVTYVAPVGTDNCSGATTVRIAGPASGSVFPVGTTTVTHRVTDGNGSTAQCSFTVTVSDTQLPQITCPANIVMNNDPGVCGAAVTYAAPVGTDNCPGAATVRIAGPASGSVFPVGTTTVTHRVTDGSGNSAQCSFTVTVNDVQNPSISCPANIAVGSSPGICGAVVSYVAPVGTDNCAGIATVRIAGLASGATFPPGTTTVTYRASDASGNTAQCSFTVTVTAADNDGDGVCDNVDLDNDNDGISDAAEGGAALDTDGDGVPNRFDLDSDNDGIYDCVESGSAQPFTAGVLNGAVIANGIPVSVDANANNVVDYTINDSDSDGTIDSQELDADNDGCTDVIEAGFMDTNGDGVPGNAPVTVNGNGLVTSLTP